MPNMLERGIAYLAKTLPVAAGGQISYSRGVFSVTLLAVFGQTTFEVEADGNVRLVKTDRDFIVQRSLLLFGSTQVTPTRGDRITHDGEVYEVLAPSGADVYRMDPTKTIYRIHAMKL